MMRSCHLLPSFVLSALCATTAAQGPVDPPPWWGVNDEVTVSLSWDFNAPFQGPLPPPIPQFESVASWYANPTPWSASGQSAPLQHLASLNGHVGVCALVGNGTTQQVDLDLFVDNDPHVDWIKVFWFQADVFPGASGSLRLGIQQDLPDYDRANVTQTVESIGQGWERWTISAKLIPQPDDESMEFLWIETANGTVAIDNVHVSSKCIKPRADENGGDAMGSRVTGGGQQNHNLTINTLGRTCRAVAVTLGPAPGLPRRRWVGANSTTALTPHEVLEVSAAGVPVGPVTPLSSTGTSAPLGILDMSVERRWLPGGTLEEVVYALVRQTNGLLRITALDPNGNGAILPALSTVVPAAAVTFNQNQRLGMAFDPTGNNGVGTFWIAGPTGVANTWRAIEYSRGGVPLDNFTLPSDTVGLDYDEQLGNFYAFTKGPHVSPSGAVYEVVGVEISGYTHQPTGVRFFGDLSVPGAAGSPGGQASGLTAYRNLHDPDSELRFACVADAPGNQQFYYEIAGPFRYGYSRYGTIGMRNGPPQVGGNYDITLSGVRDSLLAMLFIGDISVNVPIGPEAYGSVFPFVSSPLVAPLTPGEFEVNIQLPPSPALSYLDTYYQWAVLDTSAPGFLGFTQAGKTVIYP